MAPPDVPPLEDLDDLLEVAVDGLEVREGAVRAVPKAEVCALERDDKQIGRVVLRIAVRGVERPKVRLELVGHGPVVRRRGTVDKP